MHHRSGRSSIFLAIAMALALLCGCQKSSPAQTTTISGIPDRFASAEQIEESFRGRSFILGDNAGVALVRPVHSAKDARLKLPFWFGINPTVPGAQESTEVTITSSARRALSSRSIRPASG
jgi:hypothetical protein